MNIRNWEDFVAVDDEGNIIHRSPFHDEGTSVDLAALIASAGVIQGHATTTPGQLNNENDGDFIAVNLTAGQTYTWSYRGTDVDGVSDPYLRLIGADNVVLAADDDGGFDRTSQITFTATTSGTYYLNATSWYQADPTAPDFQDNGNYTIVQWSPVAAEDAGATIATAGSINVGTNYNYIDAVGDRDYYAVELVAGNLYNFTYNGGVAGEPVDPGESIGVLGLYTATGATAVGLSVNTGGETAISYFAQTSGTFYLRAEAYSNFIGGAPQTGGYTLDVTARPLASLDPLDAIDWKSSDVIDTTLVNGVKTAKVYFAVAGETFGERTGANPINSYGWNDIEKAAVMDVLEEYTKILGINYEITTNSAEAEFRLITTAGPGVNYGAYMYPQDPAYGTQEGVSAYNVNSGGWDKPGVSTQNLPGDQVSLNKGGFAYAVILHEMGHGHGLAHPHDRGGGSDIMPGVTAATNSYGVYNLNQGVYTVMSYNDAWDFNPAGGSPFTISGIGRGWSGTLGAFDIAMLQKKYGVRPDYATGNDTYTLKDVNATGTYYETIYDTKGNDTINYVGARDVQIDLLAATLDYTATGGGAMSYATGIFAGYTIANGVEIENATGGSGNDVLLGNALANVLTGNAGNDNLLGRGGNDYILGGEGNDRVTGGDGLDVVSLGAGNDIFVAEVGASKLALKGANKGTMSVDIITDFNGNGDLIDLSDLGNFTFRGTDANKYSGAVTYKSFDSINGAENALGLEIDGNPGASGIGGPVTVVFGNTNGGAADFAIVLLNTRNVDAGDFILNDAAEATLASSAAGGYYVSDYHGPMHYQGAYLA